MAVPPVVPLEAAVPQTVKGRGGIVVTHVALAEALLALGVEEFGLTNAQVLKYTQAEFLFPDTVFDIGSASEPNLELLADIRPEFILHLENMPPDHRILARIAPVVSIPFRTTEEEDSLQVLLNMLFTIASIIGAQEEAHTFQERVSETFSALRSGLKGRIKHPVLGIDITWSRIFATWGQGSLFDGVLRELGLRNAVTFRDRPVGWAYLTFQEMLEMEGVHAVHVGPIPQKTLNSPVWPLLPFVRENRITSLPKLNLYSGGVLTAEHLALNLGATLGG